MLLELFRKKAVRFGEEIDIRQQAVEFPSFSNGYIHTITYGIYLHGTSMRAGYIDLRVGMNEEMYYAGNVGYQIKERYRGHHYAYKACLLLFEEARELGVYDLLITCSPENEASRKTLERLGGELIETVDVPKEHWLYKRGEKVKNIYRYDLH